MSIKYVCDCCGRDIPDGERDRLTASFGAIRVECVLGTQTPGQGGSSWNNIHLCHTCVRSIVAGENPLTKDDLGVSDEETHCAAESDGPTQTVLDGAEMLRKIRADRQRRLAMILHPETVDPFEVYDSPSFRKLVDPVHDMLQYDHENYTRFTIANILSAATKAGWKPPQ